MTVESRYYDSYWCNRPVRDSGYTNDALKGLFDRWVPEGCECLDFGCGDGSTSGPYLTTRRCRYTGVDVSTVACDRARALGLDVRAIEPDTPLPFESDSFDRAICIEVIEHLLDPMQTMRELLRVLKPGGLLILSTPNTVFWRRRLDYLFLGRWNPYGDSESLTRPWRDPHIRFLTLKTLLEFVRQTGFEAVDSGGHSGAALPFIPVVGRFIKHVESRSSRGYRFLERVFPAMFGMRLFAVCRKPRN